MAIGTVEGIGELEEIVVDESVVVVESHGNVYYLDREGVFYAPSTDDFGTVTYERRKSQRDYDFLKQVQSGVLESEVVLAKKYSS